MCKFAPIVLEIDAKCTNVGFEKYLVERTLVLSFLSGIETIVKCIQQL